MPFQVISCLLVGFNMVFHFPKGQKLLCQSPTLGVEVDPHSVPYLYTNETKNKEKRAIPPSLFKWNKKGKHKSRSEHLIRNGLHKQYFFWKHQSALNNHKVFLITKKINGFKTKPLKKVFWKTFFIFWGLWIFFVRLKNWFLDLHQVKVIFYCHYLML